MQRWPWQIYVSFTVWNYSFECTFEESILTCTVFHHPTSANVNICPFLCTLWMLNDYCAIQGYWKMVEYPDFTLGSGHCVHMKAYDWGFQTPKWNSWTLQLWHWSSLMWKDLQSSQTVRPIHWLSTRLWSTRDKQLRLLCQTITSTSSCTSVILIQLTVINQLISKSVSDYWSLTTLCVFFKDFVETNPVPNRTP